MQLMGVGHGMYSGFLRLILFTLTISCCLGAFCNDSSLKTESLYVVDQGNFRIRVASPIGVAVSTLAGNGVSSSVDGYGKSTSFKAATYSTLSRDGNTLYVSDSSCVRSIYLSDGFFEVNTVVGNCAVAGNVEGPKSIARIGNAVTLFSDVADRGLYIADLDYNRIRYFNFSTGVLKNVLGSGGVNCLPSGTGTSMTSHQPRAMYVSNDGSYMLFSPWLVSRIYYVNTSTWNTSLFAGNCAIGNVDGVGTDARFNYISSMAVDQNETKIYLGDQIRKALRVVTFPGAVVTTIPVSITADTFNFIALSLNNRLLYSVANLVPIHTTDLSTAVRTRTSGTSGYSDGTFSSGTVFFNKLSGCTIGYLYSFSSCYMCKIVEYQNTSVKTSLTCIKCPIGTYSSSADASSCTSCMKGTFSSITGGTVCQNCSAGGYSSMPGSSVCENCIAGTFSTGIGAISSMICQNCTTGSYSLQRGSMCQMCSAGSYASQARSLFCQNCTAGTYSTVIGADNALVCQNCTNGTYSAAGAFNCINCDTGFSSSDGAAYCTLTQTLQSPVCVVGTYGMHPNCNPCPPNTNSSVNHTSTLLDCRCLPGFFCTYSKRINVRVTLSNITWDMLNVAGLASSPVIDAIAAAAGVSRDSVIINGVIAGSSGRRMMTRIANGIVNPNPFHDSKDKVSIWATVLGATSLDHALATALLDPYKPESLSWTHSHSIRVDREWWSLA